MTQTIDYGELDLKANLGAFSEFDAQTVVPEVIKLKPGEVYLEVGVDKGKSLSIARMVAGVEVEVVGVDLQPDPEVPGTIFIQGDSTKVKYDKKVNVIFIDGDHTYEGCKGDIDNWLPQMAEGGVMLFHDCDATSPGVEKAVKELGKKLKKDVFYHPEQRCSMARIYL